MEHFWNDTDKGKTEVTGEKPVLLPLCPHKPGTDRLEIKQGSSQRKTGD
jgi:hypothetical protein